MTVRKRDGKRGIKWFVDVLLPNGERYRRVVGSKKQAEQIHRQVELEIVEGKWNLRKSEGILFSDLVKEYLEYAMTSKAKSTYEIDTYRINAHLLPYFGHIILSDITVQMVDKYKAKRIKDNASTSTINNELANLSHIFKMAIRWGHTDKNIVSQVDKMRIVRKPFRFLSQEEIQLLIDAAEGSHIQPIIIAAIHTGMRKAELLNLKWTDVDFNQKIITVQSKDDWHTKNYKSRSLQMTPALDKVFRQHRAIQESQGFLSEYVFTYEGKRILWGVDVGFNYIVKKAGLDGVTLHTLRHTFASQLVMAGVPLRDVQELMGHQSFQTTLQYAHLSEEHVKSQVLRLPYATREISLWHENGTSLKNC